MNQGPPPSTPPQPTAPTPPHWSLADLIDFEVLLAREADTTEPSWKEPWQAARPTPPTPPATPAARRSLFHQWLEFRRRDPSLQLPGEALASGWLTLAALATAAGLLLGATITGTLLHYRGTEPVNVAWFLVATLGIPWLVLLASATLTALRNAAGSAPPFRRLVASLTWSASLGLRRLPGEQRQHLRALLASLARRRAIYGPLAAWPAIIVTQLFAVGYYLGILALFLTHVATTDLAFGWQSTLDLGPEAVHRIVTTLAAPWAPFAPNPHPSLDHIVRSRFAYTDGLSTLNRDATTSWWPFLAYAIATYGLAFRSATLAFATLRLRRTLASWTFDHEGCNSLARLLAGPVILTRDNNPALVIPAPDPTQPTPHPHPDPAHPHPPCTALVASDFDPSTPFAQTVIPNALGLTVAASAPVQIDHPSGNPEALRTLQSPPHPASPVVVVTPAHRAPIKAIALFLQRIASTAGPHRELIVLLVGRPLDNPPGFAPVPDHELRNWRNTLAIHQIPASLERLQPAPRPTPE